MFNFTIALTIALNAKMLVKISLAKYLDFFSYYENRLKRKNHELSCKNFEREFHETNLSIFCISVKLAFKRVGLVR